MANYRDNTRANGTRSNITERDAKHNTKCDDDDNNNNNNNNNNNKDNNNKGKVKVKFTPEHVTKTQRGSKCMVLLFLGPRRYMGWMVNATPRPLYPRDRPGTDCIEGWVGPRAGLDG